VQHMVATAKRAAAFNGQQILGFLHHTEAMLIALRIGANSAQIVFGYMKTVAAKADLGFHLDQRFGQCPNILLRRLQQMKSQPRGGFTANTGEFAELGFQPGKSWHAIQHQTCSKIQYSNVDRA